MQINTGLVWKNRGMLINEIFKSIQGETSYAGLPCTFIRITGCNLRCLYCDTPYAYDQGEEMSLSSIIENVAGYMSRLVCITGGEPLSNQETPALIHDLLSLQYTVMVETNGSYDIRTVPANGIRIMDIKCPDSEMHRRMNWNNIDYLTKKDEVKFVLSSESDYEWMVTIINHYNLTDIASVLVSTVYGKVSPRIIVQRLLHDNLQVRFQLQLHKYIWPPETRGV